MARKKRQLRVSHSRDKWSQGFKTLAVPEVASSRLKKESMQGSRKSLLREALGKDELFGAF